MSGILKIKLVGAKTYATMKKIYVQGMSYEPTPAEWMVLREELHHATGMPMFAECSEAEVVQEALADAGMPEDDGTIDTASTMVSDTDPLPEGEDLPQGAPDPSTDLSKVPATGKRILVGKKASEAVQV